MCKTQAAAFLLILLATFTGCRREDDDGNVATIPTYSGFMVDDTVYAVDSLVIDTTGPGCSARLYSATADGGMVEIHSRLDQWPAAEGKHFYLPVPPGDLLRYADSTGVLSICFTPKGENTALFCLEPPPTLAAPFGIEVSNGKLKFYQYYRNSNSDLNHRLGIDYMQP